MNQHARLPAALFDEFVAIRPDEERRELIEGSFVMRATPNIDHQIIVLNLARLLNDGLDAIGAERIAVPSLTVDLTPVIAGNKFVPDVLVLDTADIVPGRHTMEISYLAAEIVSSSDRRRIVRRGRPRIEIRRDGYAQLPDCEAILIVEQETYGARIGRRGGEGWTWMEPRIRAPRSCCPASAWAAGSPSSTHGPRSRAASSGAAGRGADCSTRRARARSPRARAARRFLAAVPGR